MSFYAWNASEALKAAGNNAASLECIRAARKKEIEIVLTTSEHRLLAFGDESHDERSERVFAVAGVLGTREEWDSFEIAWRHRTGGRIFHAADCEADLGDYAGIGHDQNLKLYADLTKLLAKSNLMGHAAVVSLKEYHAAFPSDFSDEPYFWCFGDVIRALGGIAFLSVPQQMIEFTFDHALDQEYNAGILYDFIVHKSDSPLRPFLTPKISFAGRDIVGIQVADLVVHEAMKNLDNQIGPVKRRVRQSIKALHATRRFTFVDYRKGGFEALKQSIAKMDIPGATLPEYRTWLSTNKFQDCMTNRIRYLDRPLK